MCEIIIPSIVALLLGLALKILWKCTKSKIPNYRMQRNAEQKTQNGRHQRENNKFVNTVAPAAVAVAMAAKNKIKVIDPIHSSLSHIQFFFFQFHFKLIFSNGLVPCACVSHEIEYKFTINEIDFINYRRKCNLYIIYFSVSIRAISTAARFTGIIKIWNKLMNSARRFSRIRIQNPFIRTLMRICEWPNGEHCTFNSFPPLLFDKYFSFWRFRSN